MADNPIGPTDFVGAHMKEAIKTYSVFDGSNRLSEFHSALTEAKEGSRTFKTEYVYDGATTRVVKTKESFGVWQAGWDI